MLHQHMIFLSPLLSPLTLLPLRLIYYILEPFLAQPQPSQTCLLKYMEEINDLMLERIIMDIEKFKE